MASVFYTPVSGDVTGPLNSRKAYYGEELRGDGAHAWLFKKIAYATAVAKGSIGTAQLAVPTKGGLGRVKGSSTVGGMYQAIAADKNSYQFIPKPHINSVTISAEGDYGSILKAEVKFTVYTRAQLDEYMPFFNLSGELGINYGWNDAGGAGGKPGKFQGIIYNFTYSVTSTGAFDCTSYAMQGGSSILSGNADATNAAQTIVTDALENEIHPMGAYTEIQAAFANEKEGFEDGGEPIEGIAVVQMAKDWAEPKEEDDEGNPVEIDFEDKEPKGYVALWRLVKELNILYHTAVDNASGLNANQIKLVKGIAIQCDDKVTRGNMPADSTVLVSANPTEVLFPGYSSYGTDAKNSYTFGSYDSAFQSGDLSKTMISIDYLQKIWEDLGKDKSKGTKASDQSVSKVLQQIFDIIFKNSGNRFKLSLISKPGSATGAELLIVNPDYVESDPKPYEITAVDQGGIARSISLTSKLPSEMATAAFIGAQSSFSDAPGITNITTGGDGKSKQPDPIKLEQAIKNMDGQGPTPENVKNLQTALNNVRTATPDLKGAVPVPLDFSVTLDGIEGFVFGNTITTNYLPSIYKKPSTTMAFTVTKVNHSISGGDWTTTLNTVCRIVNK